VIYLADFAYRLLRGLDHCPHALGAQHHPNLLTALQNRNLLKIGAESSVGGPLRETAVVAKGCGLPTRFTFRHFQESFPAIIARDPPRRISSAHQAKILPQCVSFFKVDCYIPKGRTMTEMNNLLGNIFVSHRAIATIAHQAAMESYGVVGLAAKNLAEGWAQAIVRDPTMGVDVHFDGDAVRIDLYIVIEYGTRITSVAGSVSNSVRYQIEKAIGLKVSAVNVHVRGLRVSNTD
jgi:uncharacterized alkaline shock family protein YloU